MNTVMTLGKGIFRVLFVLLVQSAIWSIHVCKPLDKAELSSGDDDQFRPHFSKFPTWPPTFVPPFVWPTFAPPIVLPTFNPPIWINEFDLKVMMPTGLAIFIIILTGIAGLVVFLCKYNGCIKDSSTNASTAIVHTQPTRILPTNLNRSTQQPLNVAMPTNGGASNRFSRNTQQLQNVAMPTNAGASISLTRNTKKLRNVAMPTCAGASISHSRNAQQLRNIAMPTNAVASIDLSRNTQQFRNVATPTNAGASNNLSRNMQQLRNEPMTTNAGVSNSLSRNTLQFQNATVLVLHTGASNTNNVTDKPPSYSDVVISDLVGGTLTFPNVSITAPHELPPPKYEKGDLL